MNPVVGKIGPTKIGEFSGGGNFAQRDAERAVGGRGARRSCKLRRGLGAKGG
jgi:hypothetical protein